MTNIIDAVIEKQITYLAKEKLVDLFDIAQELNASNPVDSIFVEAGCALGGSAITLAAAKYKQRRLVLYDTFSMIPAPSSYDGQDVHDRYQTIVSGQSKGIGGNTYYGYIKDLKGVVKQNFEQSGYPTEEHQVYFVQGLYEESLYLSDSVLFAHIDCDWYASVKTCLERIAPHLVMGGVIAIDDYGVWSGCAKAVDEFLDKGRFEFDVFKKEQIFLKRKM
jgi:hypothetical protein